MVGKISSLARDDGVGALIRRLLGRSAMRLTGGRLYGNLPVHPDKVLFMTFSNRYECNPKYIAEELLARSAPYDLVWAVRDSRNVDLSDFPEGIRLVKRESLAFFRELATARVWVDNGINCLKIPTAKKPGQVLFETWHGSMGLKRIDLDTSSDVSWQAAVTRIGRATDYCLSNSGFETEVFRRTYWPDAEILPYGHARNDILCNCPDARRVWLREVIAQRYGIPASENWVLYAPTFRDSHDLGFATLDLERLSRALAGRFGGRWRVLVRLHFHNRGQAGDLWEGEAGWADVSDYPDIQELLAVADAGVTDYSSWCCDYVLTKRPCFIFAPDLDDFAGSRGFYYPIEETPFPLARDNCGLEAAVASFDEGRYRREVERFLNDRGSYEDGRAAQRAADKIDEIMERPNGSPGEMR